MEEQASKWLRTKYRPAHSEGPAAKRVKFGVIQTELATQFPDRSIDVKTVAKSVKAAFPESISRVAGKLRTKHIFGVEEIPDRPSSSAACVASDLRIKLEREREEKKQLQCKIHELEAKLPQREHISQSLISSELDGLVDPKNTVYHGPDTISHFRDFDIDRVLAEFSQQAPNLFTLLTSLGQGPRAEAIDDDHAVRVAMTMSILLKCRSVRVLGVQLLVTLMLLARATSRQAITVLNHAGVSVSYQTAWKYLKHVTAEAHYQETVRSGHWQWVFDNLNLYQPVRHEREDRHSSMLNITSRLAIRLRYLPEWEFDWSDMQPQRSRESLNLSDFLPDERDAAELKTRAIQYVMRFLVQEFSGLHDLAQFAPEQQTLNPAVKSEVVPMKVLFKDEKFTTETIDILTQLVEDGNLQGSCQMVIGDQLTCKNVRASRRWRQAEQNIKDRFTWAKEVDEFLVHAFKAHLVAGILVKLNITSTTDALEHTISKEWLENTAEQLVDSLLMPKNSDDPVYNDPVYHLHHAFLHHAFLYVDLREAIRWENGPQIVRHWKWWLPRFLGTGKKNYASESVHTLCNLVADFPKHMAYIATHNRTVNLDGKPEHGKPVDQMIEHYNLVFKQTLRSAGSTLTTRHVEDVSLGVLFLFEAAKKTDKAFKSAPQSTAHAIRSAQDDISKITGHLLAKHVTTVSAGRDAPAFVNQTQIGWQKLSNTSWLQDRLAASVCEEEVEADTVNDVLDLDYELSTVV